MKHFSPQFESKLAFLGKMVFDVRDGDEAYQAEQFILRLEDFFKSINTPIRLQEINVTSTDKAKILENLKLNNVSGRVFTMNESDHEMILEKMW